MHFLCQDNILQFTCYHFTDKNQDPFLWKAGECSSLKLFGAFHSLVDSFVSWGFMILNADCQ